MNFIRHLARTEIKIRKTQYLITFLVVGTAKSDSRFSLKLYVALSMVPWLRWTQTSWIYMPKFIRLFLLIVETELCNFEHFEPTWLHHLNCLLGCEFRDDFLFLLAFFLSYKHGSIEKRVWRHNYKLLTHLICKFLIWH